MAVGRFSVRAAVVGLGLALAGLCAGCGGDGLPRERVTGRVTLDGRPLDSGTVTFLPADPSSAATPSEADLAAGEYQMAGEAGPVPGSYRVVISSTRPGAPAARKPAGKTVDATSGTGAGGAAEEPPLREAVPARYNAQSELKAEVKKGGPNVLNFDLTSK